MSLFILRKIMMMILEYTLFSKKPLYNKPVPFAEKITWKIRNFLGLIQIFMKLFGGNFMYF